MYYNTSVRGYPFGIQMGTVKWTFQPHYLSILSLIINRTIAIFAWKSTRTFLALATGKFHTDWTEFKCGGVDQPNRGIHKIAITREMYNWHIL